MLRAAKKVPRKGFLWSGSEVYTSDDGVEHWRYLSPISRPDAVQMAYATCILGIAIASADPNRMDAALEVGGAARSSDGAVA